MGKDGVGKDVVRGKVVPAVVEMLGLHYYQREG